MKNRSGKGLGLILAGLIVFLAGNLHAQKNYRSPEQVASWCTSFSEANQEYVKLVKLADSPGGHPVHLLEIGIGIKQKGYEKPAVLVVANMNGLRPITTEGAIDLCERLAADPGLLEKRSYYVIPVGNPDAAARFFHDVKVINPGNDTPENDDLDESTDEDGFDDLNGDGYITLMRKKHPEGTMIPVADEARLMRKADKKDGETGMYKIYKEGLDNDGDGKYNEDGRGGTNVNLNFPHLFQPFDAGTGIYPGSAPESRSLIEYAYLHPEIAMAVALGETNFCVQPPKGGRSGDADLSKITIPEYYLSMLNAEKGKSYTMEEIIEMVKPLVPAGMEVTESLIASFLGLGAAVNPLPEDLSFYNKLSKDYKAYLEEEGVKGERFNPEAAKDGSFELWAYYHLGIPVFSMDLFSVSKPEEKKEEGSGITLESLEEMTTEEFVALGEEKIDLFLKESGAPEQFSAKRIIGMMEGGQADPKQMASMMKQMPKPKKDEKSADPEESALLAYSEKILQGKGFINWEKFEHPTLGAVEIGGFIPYLGSTPPYPMVDSILDIQVPWILKLANHSAELGIFKTKVSPRGGGVYQLEIWTENKNYLPFPTAMGKRNNQPAPAILVIEGEDIEFLEGYKRTSIQSVPGHSRVKNTWLIRSDKPGELDVRLLSKSAGTDVKSVKLGG